MNQKWALLIGIILLVAAICVPLVIDYESSSTPKVVSLERAAVQPHVHTSVARRNMQRLQQQTRASADQVQRSYDKPFPVTPSLAQYRAEAAKNFHEIPDSLVKFSAVMAREMRRAEGSFERTEAFFHQLEICAGAPKGAEVDAVRATCAANAKRLAAAYPKKLKKRFAALFAKLDKRVKTLLL